MKIKKDYKINDTVMLTRNILSYDVPTKGWIGTVKLIHANRNRQQVLVLIDRGAHTLVWHISYSNLKPAK